jgi:hypothetical protein
VGLLRALWLSSVESTTMKYAVSFSCSLNIGILSMGSGQLANKQSEGDCYCSVVNALATAE